MYILPVLVMYSWEAEFEPLLALKVVAEGENGPRMFLSLTPLF